MLKAFTTLFRPKQLCAFQQQIPLVNRLYSTEIPTEKPANASAIQTKQTEIDHTGDYEPDSLCKKLEIEIKGCDPAVLQSYSWFATTAAGHLGIQVGNCWAERKSRKRRLTLLKSAHVHKKHRVQYEMRTYYRFLEFHKLTGSTLSTFLEYIERNLPEGVALKATKLEIQSIPDHLKEPPAV